MAIVHRLNNPDMGSSVRFPIKDDENSLHSFRYHSARISQLWAFPFQSIKHRIQMFVSAIHSIGVSF
jgi:hypothetical protein